MKKVLLIVGIGFLVLIQSCKKDDDNDIVVLPDFVIIPEEIVAPEGEYLQVEVESYFNESVVLSPNQLVVRLDESLSEEEKNDLRTEFHVESMSGCPCDDSGIELWTINTDTLDIETALSNLKNKKDEEGVEGDRQFTLFVPRPNSELDNETGLPVSDVTPDVNIAIIDTGISVNIIRDSEDELFLYDDRGFYTCREGMENPQPYEYNGLGFDRVADRNGHGTYVTKMITSILAEEKVTYNILPIKVFNRFGRGSYWNIVCAMNHIKNFPDIKLVNASFGGTINSESTELLENVINDLGTNHNVLVVCSAGNNGIDTDTEGNEHFPSGYDSDNIIAVGGYDVSASNRIGVFSDNRVEGIVRHPNSNYGMESIDIAASFENYIDFSHGYGQVSIGNKEFIKLIGTSYSTAFITAQCAILYKENPNASPKEIKRMLLESAFYSRELNNEIKDGKVILLENPLEL